MSQVWTISLAGVELPCQFRYPETHQYFTAVPCGQEADARAPVVIREPEWNEYLRGFPADAHTEYSVLTASFGDALLAHDRAVFHGAALRWRDRAWLICGDSGVGKSTQARFLQELRPGEFGVICGDRPILEYCHSERSAAESKNPPFSVPASSVGAVIGRPPEASVLVHPSPWNGKENWHGAPAAPLAGIILLSRGEDNSVEALRARLAVLPVFRCLIQTFWEEEKIRAAAELVDRMLRLVPVWRMRSHEVPASTELLLNTLFS